MTLPPPPGPGPNALALLPPVPPGEVLLEGQVRVPVGVELVGEEI